MVTENRRLFLLFALFLLLCVLFVQTSNSGDVIGIMLQGAVV